MRNRRLYQRRECLGWIEKTTRRNDRSRNFPVKKDRKKDRESVRDTSKRNDETGPFPDINTFRNRIFCVPGTLASSNPSKDPIHGAWYLGMPSMERKPEALRHTRAQREERTRMPMGSRRVEAMDLTCGLNGTRWMRVCAP